MNDVILNNLCLVNILAQKFNVNKSCCCVDNIHNYDIENKNSLDTELINSLSIPYHHSYSITLNQLLVFCLNEN